MESLRQYIVSVVAAAVFCAFISTVLSEKGTAGALIKLVSGIFLAFVVIRPILDVQIVDISSLWDSYASEADDAVAQGENLARDAMASIIKERTEAYILDKGASLGLELSAAVTVSDDDMPIPVGVVISGKLSPASKVILQNWLQEELGIAKENQIWTA